MSGFPTSAGSRTSLIRRVCFEESAGAATFGLAPKVLGFGLSTLIWCTASRCESDMVAPRELNRKDSNSVLGKRECEAWLLRKREELDGVR